MTSNRLGAREMAAIGEAGEVGEEAAERMSERGDTAYSPRFREEEHSAASRRTRTTPSEGEFGIISTQMGKGIIESTVEEIKRLVEKV